MTQPSIAPSARLFEGAVVTGAVTLGEQVSIWHNAVLRGDIGTMSIGRASNIQDCCVLHNETGCSLQLGEYVTVGHMCILHSCSIGSNTLIGMGSILMNHVKVGRNCMIGAGSLLTEGTVVPDGMMAYGRPARVVRPCTPEEIEGIHGSALHYLELLEAASQP